MQNFPDHQVYQLQRSLMLSWRPVWRACTGSQNIPLWRGKAGLARILQGACTLMVAAFACVDDDEAVDAVSHAAMQAYSQSSPEKNKAIKIGKVRHLTKPSEEQLGLVVKGVTGVNVVCEVRAAQACSVLFMISLGAINSSYAVVSSSLHKLELTQAL